MKPFAYKVWMDYDEKVSILPTLEKAVKLCSATFSASHAVMNNYITAIYEDGSEKDIGNEQFIECRELSIKELKKIENDIDIEIKKNKEYLKSTLSKGAMITGFLGITSEDRESAIKNEIKNRSYKWKDLNKIDWDKVEI